MVPYLNITIPVFNEERVLAHSISTLMNFLDSAPQFQFEIVIANNGSTDRTRLIAEELCRCHSVIRLINIEQSGRGRALKQAWLGSEAQILCYMDVDLATDLSCFWPLVSALAEGRFDLATGSRRLKGSMVQRSAKRQLFSDAFHLLVRSLFSTNLSDTQCGFKAITGKAANDLLPSVLDTGWLMDTELLILAERKGYRIFEMPVVWRAGIESRVEIGSSVLRCFVGLLYLRCRLAKSFFLR